MMLTARRIGQVNRAFRWRPHSHRRLQWDASADFAHSEKSSKYSENLIINEYVENEKELLNTEKVSLTREGKRALDSGLLDFRALCGDEFIIGKVRAVRFQRF